VKNQLQPDESREPSSEYHISDGSTTSGPIGIQDPEIMVQAKDHPCRECSMSFASNAQLKSHLR